MIRVTDLLTDKRFHLFFLFTVSFLFLFARLREGSLGGYDDAFFALKGRQMLQTGSWWKAYVEDYPYVQPLFIWLEAIAFALMGATDYAARFFPALAGVATIMLIYHFAFRLSENEQNPTLTQWWPIFAAIVLVTTQQFTKYARHAMTDTTFVFFTTASLFFYCKAIKQQRNLLLFGVFVGLAVLTRSIIGLFPVGVACLHLTLARRWRRDVAGYFLGGLAVACALVGSWYIPNYMAQGSVFLRHQLDFIKSKADTPEPDSMWNYFAYLTLMVRHYWPWLPFLIAGFAMAIKKAIKGHDETSLFLIIWVLAIFLPFSFAEAKTLRYLLPAFPAFSLLAAYPLVMKLSEAGKMRAMKLFSISLYIVVLLYVALPTRLHLDRSPHLRRMGHLVQEVAPAGTTVYFYLGGAYLGDRLYELIWYTNRPVTLLRDGKQVEDLLSQSQRQVIVLGKETYESMTDNTGPQAVFRGAFGDYVCITNTP